MKKFLFLSSLAALTLASCSDDFAPGNNLNQGIEGKSIAHVTFPIDNEGGTRTVLGENGKSVIFEIGDAIGLFSTAQGSGVQNAPFVYKPTTEGDAFVGQIYLTSGKEYYAYYPYSQTQDLSPTDGFTFIINPEQSFNALQCNGTPTENYNWGSTTYDGSFSNNTVPGYAIAEAGKDNEISFTLNGLSSFIVIPVTGYTQKPIQQVTLALSNSKAPQVIAGQFNVNPETFATTQKYTVKPLDSDTENKGELITLNCGEGLQLNLGEIVNLWFVVPAGITFDSATLTFVDGIDDGQHEFIRPLNNPYTTKLNAPGRLAYSSKTPFEYIQGGSAPISSALAFLEYANLVTNGLDIDNYNALITAEGNNSNLALSSLNTFLGETAFVQETQGANIKGQLKSDAALSMINPALVTETIDLSPENVYDEIKDALKLTDNKFDVIILPDYFAYLKDYLNNEGLSTSIGGQVDFTLSGLQGTISAENSDNNVQIKNLQVNANGLFNPGSAYKVNVNGLTFVNTTVNVAGIENETNFYFLSNMFAPTGVNTNIVVYEDVVIGEECTIIGAGDANTALLNEIYSSQMDVESYITNNSTSITKYGNTLFMQGPKWPADFTKYDVNDFNTIDVQEEGALAIVTNTTSSTGQTNAQTVINKVKANKAYNGTAYSIYSENSDGIKTSYWTGTNYNGNGTLGYAENLAYEVINKGTSFKLTMDLNLMNIPWPILERTGQSNSLVVNGANGDDTFTISNVMITPAGYQTTSGTNYFSLFGMNPGVKNLTIDGVTIQNYLENEDGSIDEESINDNALIGILGTRPSTSVQETTENITVIGDVIINVSSTYNKAVGGLFQFIQSNSQINTTNLTLDFEDDINNNGGNNTILWGKIAGEGIVFPTPVEGKVGSYEVKTFDSTLYGSVSSVQLNDPKAANNGYIYLKLPSNFPVAGNLASNLNLNVYGLQTYPNILVNGIQFTVNLPEGEFYYEYQWSGSGSKYNYTAITSPAAKNSKKRF